MTANVTVTLTKLEARMVAICLQGELENDDGSHDGYMPALARAVKKLNEAGAVVR